MINRITNNTAILEKSIDAAVLRNDTINQNISNIDTPNYKRKDVSFEDQFNEAMKLRLTKSNLNHEKHIPIGIPNGGALPRIVTVGAENQMRIDGNNVDIESEMALMAKNTIKYNVLIQRLNGGFSTLKSVIRGGN